MPHKPYDHHLPAGEVSIYALYDPNTGETRYVGATRLKPSLRLSKHRTVGRWPQHGRYSRKNPLMAWIREVQSRGSGPESEPQVRELQRVRACDRDAAERYWIQRLKREGHPLLNVHGCKPEVVVCPESVPDTPPPDLPSQPLAFWGT